MGDRDPDLVPARIDATDTTPYAPDFDDVYFSREGGWSESRFVFLQGNGLPERWRGRDSFVIGETGFGIGLNFIITACEFLRTTTAPARLHYVSVEKHPVEPSALRVSLIQNSSEQPDARPLIEELYAASPIHSPGTHRVSLAGGRVQLTLLLGEAAVQLARVPTPADGLVDAWFLDGFSPAKNSGIWNENVYRAIARLTRCGGTLATYTSAGAVRRGLGDVGFEIRKVPGFGRKREMTVGTLAERGTTRRSPTDDTPWFDVLGEPGPRTKTRVAVIGAGLAGAAVASTLAERGYDVTIYDQATEIATGASGNPVGAFYGELLRENNFRERLYAAAHDGLVRRLVALDSSEVTKAEPSWWSRGGALHLIPPRQQERYAEIETRRRPDSRHCRFVDADEASELSGIEIPHRALLYPSGGWVRPRVLCERLIERSSIALRTEARIERLERRDDAWQLIGPDGQTIAAAPVVILASARDAKRLFRDALPLRAVRGQLSFLAATPVTRELRSVVHYGGYVTPAIDGVHGVGATFQPGETEVEPRTEDDESNLAALCELLPQFGARPESCSGAQPLGRAAIRAVTADHLPLVGPVPDADAFLQAYEGLRVGRFDSGLPRSPRWPGLYVSAGHGSRGIVTSFLAAELLADLLDRVPLPVEQQILEHLLPARFLVRALKRNED